MRSYSDAKTLEVAKGGYLFSTRCAACHTIGGGDLIGPDLLGVAMSRDRGWLTRFIQTPDKVLAEGDPTARALLKRYNEVTMPNLRLGPEDVANIVEHLEGETRARAPSARQDLAASRAAPEDASAQR